jgi:hypothetical protein
MAKIWLMDIEWEVKVIDATHVKIGDCVYHIGQLEKNEEVYSQLISIIAKELGINSFLKEN